MHPDGARPGRAGPGVSSSRPSWSPWKSGSRRPATSPSPCPRGRPNDQPLTVVNVGEMGIHPGRLHDPGLAEQRLVPRQASPSMASPSTAATSLGVPAARGLATGIRTGVPSSPRPGTNQVTVIVDPDHSVAETSYADNTMSFTFNCGVARGGKFMRTRWRRYATPTVSTAFPTSVPPRPMVPDKRLPRRCRQ